jgi:uncharacterized protein YbjT (DUF2867 family)
MPTDGDGRSALVLGATGLVGRHCLELLLAAPGYSAVHVLTRRSFDGAPPGVVQHLVDFERLADHADLFRVDDVFCCLGTTIRKAGSPAAFRRVDVDYPATAAQLAADADAEQFLVVSAVGSDPGSRIFYNRAKGDMEARVRRAALRAVWILRPALLLGSRDEIRPGERLAEVLLAPLSPLMLGPLRRYRPVHARDVAAAMLALATSDGTGGTVESEEIPALARDAG